MRFGASAKMSITSAKPPESGSQPSQPTTGKDGKARRVIAWSSFFFALLQSICTFFAALSGLRLLIGAGSLALSAAAASIFDRLHADWLRIPMVALALFGSLLNLLVLFQIRRLRRRPASQWRQQPVSPHKLRMERLQLVLSIITLILIAVEEYWHIRWHHGHF
jgi:hypothetical protein